MWVSHYIQIHITFRFFSGLGKEVTTRTPWQEKNYKTLSKYDANINKLSVFGGILAVMRQTGSE